MRDFRLQALALVFLTLQVKRSLAFSWSSFESGVQAAATSVEGSVGAKASQIAGDLENDFETFKDDVESEIAKALNDTGGVLGQFSIELDVAPPISTRLVNSGFESNMTLGLYCEECGYSQPAAFDFASQNFTGWSSSWLGFAVDSFDAAFEVDLDLTVTENADVSLALWDKAINVDGVQVDVEFQLHVVASASASMSFTAGLNLSLLQPAAIMMPALDPLVQLNKSQRIGFDQENFSLQHIFNASRPQLDFDIQFSLRTVFSVTVEEILIGELYLDLPAFNLAAGTLSQATSNCQVPAPGTPSQDIYDELIQVNGTYVAELSYDLLDGVHTGVLESWDVATAFDDCFAFFPGLGHIDAVPPSSKSANLTAAPVTTCVTGNGQASTGTAAVSEALRSLSPGAKAGAIIGTIAGVSLIAALAWFGGRASASSSRNNGAPRTAWAIPRPRSGKFFSRGTRNEKPEFSPIAPDTSTWPTPYTGGYSPDPNQEMQSSNAQPAWAAAKQPLVSVDSAVSPAATYVPVGDDYSMFSSWNGDQTGAGYGPVLQPLTYDGGGRSGQAERASLIASEGRPALRRKEIARKSVPGSGPRNSSSP